MKILGIEFAPLIIPLGRRLQTFAVWQFTLSFMTLGFGFLFLFIYLIFTRFYFIPLSYLAWYIYDHKTSARGGRRIEWARNWRMWTHYCNYFPLKLHKTVDLDPAKNYIFACHPHGVMCISHFGNYATEGTNFSKIFPEIRPYLLVLAGQFMFPVFREYFMMTGETLTIRYDSSKCYLQNERKGNVLFNDALNTFYLRLNGVRHIVKDHSVSERRNLLPPHGLLFSIESKGSFICTIPQTG